MANRTLTLTTLLCVLALLAPAAPAEAGCGCQKPPPPLAAIRPAFASPGDTVRLFAPAIEENGQYQVTFSRPANEVTVSANAVLLRDFADGVYKPQIVVSAPNLQEGPTSVTVKRDEAVILEVPASDFTMLQRPIALAETNSEVVATCYRAAVGSDSTVYIPLDISAIDDQMIFSGIANGYRLTYEADDITIYNTQGVLMQLLGPEQASIYTIDDQQGASAPGTVSSFRLTYDRHEFITYRENHTTNPNYLHDPSDAEWHVDGTRHIDHDHLVIAIRGLVSGEDLPPPGTTPYFTFKLTTDIADGSGGSTVHTAIQWNQTCSADEGATAVANATVAAQTNSAVSAVELFDTKTLSGTDTATRTAGKPTTTSVKKVR